MIKDLVSIVTPCYNTGHLIWHLLDSVLMQTYPSVEMFVIDDGSSDDTKDVVSEYIEKFANRGYSLTYVWQENQGQSNAINRGLKLINGEYFVWPDSDDYYSDNTAIAKMVGSLRAAGKEYSTTRILTEYVDEKYSTISKHAIDGNFRKEDLFEDCLFGKNNFLWGAGNYMARVSVLLDVIPNLEICTNRLAGQNWQLLLPLLYNHKCISIEEYLYSYVIRAESHSRRTFVGYDRLKEKSFAFEEVLCGTINALEKMPIYDKSRYIYTIKQNYYHTRAALAVEHMKTGDYLYNMLKINDITTRTLFVHIMRFFWLKSKSYFCCK